METVMIAVEIAAHAAIAVVMETATEAGTRAIATGMVTIEATAAEIAAIGTSVAGIVAHGMSGAPE
jgi:hypothetical protein